jgi:ATP-binding cassette subfamily C protein
VLAIVGPTGAGKSTLIRLIAGLGTVARGLIRIDGSAIEHWDPDQLGQYIGYLPQEVDLLGGTVAEAICGFSDDPSDDDIVAAAVCADAHTMIQTLPNGYQTEIGRDGTRLSGGQRQRVGLARAFFGSRKIILLDEPNSNLDPEGEEALCRAILNVKNAGSTVIIVTHRPRILAIVDRVLVLRRGMQVSFGPPGDLRARQASEVKPKVRPEPIAGGVPHDNVKPLVGGSR